MDNIVIRVILYCAFAINSFIAAFYSVNFGLIYSRMTSLGTWPPDQSALWAYGSFAVAGFFVFLGFMLLFRAVNFARNRKSVG